VNACTQKEGINLLDGCQRQCQLGKLGMISWERGKSLGSEESVK